VADTDEQLEALLLYLKESRGFDFTGYKRSSLGRRVRRRMSQLGMDNYAEYQDYLEVHPEEFTALFNTILINVTQFFRDTEAWDHLREVVLPSLLSRKPPGEPVRFWSAGCASGEEPYSLAILLAEMLGQEEFQARVKIYATDVDDEALTHARQGSYSARDVRGLPEEYLQKYFELNGQHYVFSKDLRRSVIFGRNDLFQDAPISRIDMLFCRNTLMYFNAETQARILTRFHFALAPDGILFLGKAETLLSRSALFQPVDLKRRLFRKVSRAPVTGNDVLVPDQIRVDGADRLAADRMREAAFAATPTAEVVVTSDGLVAAASRQADVLFGVSSRDAGRPFRDLELSYRPIELRAVIEQAELERRIIRIQNVQWTRRHGDKVQFDVRVIPLIDGDSLLGVLVSFTDVSDAMRLKLELEHANRELETAYEELQSTNEELETTNEELQSTVEELETTNEELQSTNEELETMNEELQSTNDELQAINDELRDRTDALDEVNVYLESIMSSIRSGVAVVDRELRVHLWNRQAEDMWGMRADETIGQYLLNLDIGLPVKQLRPVLHRALSDRKEGLEMSLAAVNRRGKEITVRVTTSPLRGDGFEPTGAIMVMEEADRAVGNLSG
jgi:two-component system CheB/CheR fusion protein